MLILLAAIAGFLAGAGLVGFWTFRVWSQGKELESRAVILDQQKTELSDAKRMLESDQRHFAEQHVTYDELVGENRILKADVANVDVMLRKLEIDRERQAVKQDELDSKCQALGERYLRDVERWVGSSINDKNYGVCKQRLSKAIEWCRDIGVEFSDEREAQLFDDLKADFEKAVRAAMEREEQARLKKQIREEQAREREIQREVERFERERAAIQAALDKALASAVDMHSAEIESLKARLAEAEAGSQRAISQAQLTRAGHIYVISNIGSFGEGVFKIGMTRRLAPLDRVKELGDASVPFPFDVHMMISCDDAPALENALHQEFHDSRVNRVNPRKEYFRVDLEKVRAFVESEHGEVNYVADAEALEYRESLEMSDEDQEYVEDVFSRTERELGIEDTED